MTEHEPELYWDSTYAIVVALMEHHPQRRPEAVGLEELAALVEALPGFQDDPAPAGSSHFRGRSARTPAAAACAGTRPGGLP